MKVGSVKGLMYENVPPIGVRNGHRALAHTGYTSLITAGVRIGSNAEAEKVMGLLEMEIVEREEMGRMERRDARSNIPIREQPMPHSLLPPSHSTLTPL